jgi:uncharacterized repeat protein (TIGR01451 family)
MKWWLLALLVTLVPFGTSWAAGTPAGTEITNFATLTYKDANGNSLSPINSNTVTTVVAQVAGVDVSPATLTNNLAAGDSISFKIFVMNVGNGIDTLNLSYPALSSGWSAKLYLDENDNGILDTAERVPSNIISSVKLAADADTTVFLVVFSPLAAANGASEAVTVTATSQFNASVSDAGTYTSNIETAVVTAAKSSDVTTPKPGDVVTYKMDINNTGSNTAYSVVLTDLLPSNVTYVANSMKYGTGTGVDYAGATARTDALDVETGPSADFGITTANTVTVNWGDSPSGQVGVVFFRVTVNAGVTSGTTISNEFSMVYKATSGGPNLPPVTGGPTTVTVAPKPIITLSDAALALNGQPGDSVKYAFSITNSGNSNDVFDFTKTNTAGFTSQIWVDTNNDGTADSLLTDTDSDSKVDTGPLTAGQVLHIIVIVVVTPGTADLIQDVTTVTVASSVDPTVTGTVTLTTTTHAPVLSIAKTVSPTGPQPPGTVLTYTVVITNNGNGSATALQIVDMIPTNTTYQAGTITIDTVSKTDDGVDTDGAKLDSGSIVVNFASVGPSVSHTITFQVKID